MTSFFHLRTLPGYQWPALADAVFSQVWVAYLELSRTQWWTPAEIEQKQLEQVRALLAHCITNVPYYRDVLPKAGIVPGAIQTMDDFRRIPCLPRRSYQERSADFAALALPAGTIATATRSTSGSSGTPIKVLHTNLGGLWWCACFLRDLEWCNIDPTGVLATIRSTAKKGDELEKMLAGASYSCWLPELDPLIQTGPTHSMDIQRDPRGQLQWLHRIAPDYLLSYPSNLEVLAHVVKQEGPPPRLRAIQAISETLTEETQAAVEAAFGVPVKNTYSCGEAGYLASPCPQGHGLHIHAENVLLEVLTDEGRPCAPGQTGNVHVTHLHNFRGPFVRYELGDEATVGAEACPCGRGLPLLARVQGKSYPLFHLPDGRRKHSTPLARLVRKVGGHWQHQVVQKAPDHVIVRLAIDAAWSESHAEKVRQELQTFFEAPIRVEVETYDRLPLPVNGKLQSMVNEIG